MLCSVTQREELSSSFTLVAKLVFPTIFYISITLAIIGLSIEGQYLGAIAALVVLIVFGTLVYFGLVRLMAVSRDNDYFYVSNYFKTIKIPVSSLKEVNETWMINIHPIRLTFNNQTDFGDTIMFMPSFDLFASFGLHPLTKELRKLLNQ